MKFFKSWEMVHFGVVKKDPGLIFHFHVFNLFKCWSNLGLTKFEMMIQNLKKNQKNEKPAHIAFLCHIPMILVDKHGVHTLKRDIHVCHVIPQISSQA